MKLPIIFKSEKQVENIMGLLIITSPLGWGLLISHKLKNKIKFIKNGKK